jgi:hypothetical protein
MFLTIRKYSGATSVDEAISRVEEGLVPYLRSTSGFVAYYAVKYEDGGIGSVTVYDTQVNAESSGAGAIDWVRSNLSDLLPNEPTILRGEVVVHESAKAASTSA